jgi:hypothetical protein
MTVGIPGEFLYKTGAPKSKVIDSNYTELANSFCINDSQANWIAHGIVEAKEIPQVKKLLGGPAHEGPSYLWMILGGFGAFSYAKQLTTAIKQLKEITDALNTIQNSAADEPEQAHNIEPQFPGA